MAKKELKECIRRWALSLKGLIESFLYNKEYNYSRLYGLIRTDYFKDMIVTGNERA